MKRLIFALLIFLAPQMLLAQTDEVTPSYTMLRDSSGRLIYGFGKLPLVYGHSIPVGTPFFDSTTQQMYYWTGSAWSVSGVPLTGGTLTGPLLLPDGTATNVALGWTTTTGWWRTAGFVCTSVTGTTRSCINQQYIDHYSETAALRLGGSSDTILIREGAGIYAQRNGNNDQFWRHYGTNGGYWERGVNSELLTIAAAATTDTTGNLLPADAIIEAVVVRVTTVIPTAATFTVGDATTAARFATGVAVAADTTSVGLLHRNPDVAAAAGPVQSAAAKVRITPNTAPGAATGVVRVQVYFSRWIAPTT